MAMSDAKKRTNAAYLAKCTAISYKPRTEDAEAIKAAAKAAGEGVQTYLTRAAKMRMERDSGDCYQVTAPREAVDRAAAKAGLDAGEWLERVIRQALEE